MKTIPKMHHYIMVGLCYNGDDADIFVICHLREFKEISVEWKIRNKR